MFFSASNYFATALLMTIHFRKAKLVFTNSGRVGIVTVWWSYGQGYPCKESIQGFSISAPIPVVKAPVKDFDYQSAQHGLRCSGLTLHRKAKVEHAS